MNIDNIMKELVIIDGHTDIPKDVYVREKKGEKNVFYNNHFTQLRKSNVNIIFANIFTATSSGDILKEAMLQFENIIRASKENEDVIIIKDKKDLDYVLETKKLGIIISMEGFEPLDGTLELLNIYYELGLRSGTLTWNYPTPFAFGVDNSEDGITLLGRLALEKMDELGILIDVSHLNEEGFWDVIKSNKKPIIASHSNARALFNYRRNLSDEQIKAIANTGGVVGPLGYFSKVDEENPSKPREKDDRTETIDDYIKHIEYMVNLVGYDHVSFGFDFNIYFGDFGVKGLETAENIKDVIEILLKRGHKLEDVKKIAGENLLRVLYQIL